VLASTTALRDVTSRYVLVTSVSVFPGWPGEYVTTGSEIFNAQPDAGPEDGHYGELKAGCERAAVSVLGARAIAVRPGVILGPHENVGRLPWWLERFAAGGRIVVPPLDSPFQYVDVRDLAGLLVALGERGADSPVFIAVDESGRDTYGGFLRSAWEVTGKRADLVEVTDEFLIGQQVNEWSDLPLWMPAPTTNPEFAYAWNIDGSSALAAGMGRRALRDTVADTWTWLRTVENYRTQRPIGIDVERQSELLAAWDAAHRS
jgi:2'-hydroxyisoflavone reductase